NSPRRGDPPRPPPRPRLSSLATAENRPSRPPGTPAPSHVPREKRTQRSDPSRTVRRCSPEKTNPRTWPAAGRRLEGMGAAEDYGRSVSKTPPEKRTQRSDLHAND